MCVSMLWQLLTFDMIDLQTLTRGPGLLDIMMRSELTCEHRSLFHAIN